MVFLHSNRMVTETQGLEMNEGIAFMFENIIGSTKIGALWY